MSTPTEADAAAAAAAMFAHVEKLLLRVDAFILADPECKAAPSGLVMSALLVLAGGMAASGNAPFPELVEHATTLLRVGYEHQQRERL